MLYAKTNTLSCNQQQAEGGEGNIDNGCDDKHVSMCVRGLHRADIGDG